MPDKEITNKEDNSLLLLHLSDIHFREPYCLNLETDQDNIIRTSLLNDIRDMVIKLGKVDVILVSGDIAYKGHAVEYKVAADWLSEVTSVAGCSQTDIYVVPGNHDVNRILAGSRSVKAIRDLILNSPTTGAARNKELHDTLVDTVDSSALTLISPMEEYNLFAASFGCDFIPTKPFWIEKRRLCHGWHLMIHGLTTTLFSGPEDRRANYLLVIYSTCLLHLMGLFILQ